MTEWGVFGVIAAIVALFLTVGTPIMKLNSTMVRLTEAVTRLEKEQSRTRKELEEDLLKHIAKNTESHTSIWAHNKQQDAELKDHGTRITILERK